jgi:hypothetical protein
MPGLKTPNFTRERKSGWRQKVAASCIIKDASNALNMTILPQNMI